jgi:hypothetical protein
VSQEGRERDKPVAPSPPRRRLLWAWVPGTLVTFSAAFILHHGASQAASSYIAATPPTVVVPAGYTQGTTTIAWGTASTAQNGVLQEDHGGSKTTIGGPSWVGEAVATVLCGQPNNFTLLLSGSATVLDAISVPVTCQGAASSTSDPCRIDEPDCRRHSYRNPDSGGSKLSHALFHLHGNCHCDRYSVRDGDRCIVAGL